MLFATSTTSTPRPNRLRRASSTSSTFPLPDAAFAFARLSATQLDAHKHHILQRITQALDECDRSEVLGGRAYSDAWEVVAMQANVTAFGRQDLLPTPTASTKSQYRVIGDVSCNYRDLMALQYAETSNDLFEWLQFTSQSTLDAHIIQTVESQSASQPHQYFGVKWAAFQTSVFATKVDQCFVEYMTYCTDRRGREVGVRVTLPVCIPEIDLVTEGLKVRRMNSLMVQILRPVGDKTTRMFTIIENDFAPSTSTAYVKTLVSLSQHTAAALDARRIRSRGLLAESHWVPNASRRCCVVCTRTFGATRGRHHCRLCGDVVCRKCTVLRATAANPVTHKTFKVAKTKCCVVCIVRLQARDPETSVSDATCSIPGTTVDLSASTIVGVLATSAPSRTGRWMDECMSTTDSVDESTKSSVWSETDSEGDHDMAVDAIETIDTKDMLRHTGLTGMGDSPLSASRVQIQMNQSRTESANLLSARSLDENLAEQEALLRQLFSASKRIEPLTKTGQLHTTSPIA